MGAIKTTTMTIEEQKIIEAIETGDKPVLRIALITQIPYQQINALLKKMQKKGIVSKRYTATWCLNHEYKKKAA